MLLDINFIPTPVLAILLAGCVLVTEVGIIYPLVYVVAGVDDLISLITMISIQI